MPFITQNLGSDRFGSFQAPYYPGRLPAEEPVLLVFDRIVASGPVSQSCRAMVRMTPRAHEIYVVATSFLCHAYVDAFTREDVEPIENDDFSTRETTCK